MMIPQDWTQYLWKVVGHFWEYIFIVFEGVWDLRGVRLSLKSENRLFFWHDPRFWAWWYLLFGLNTSKKLLFISGNVFPLCLRMDKTSGRSDCRSILKIVCFFDMTLGFEHDDTSCLDSLPLGSSCSFLGMCFHCFWWCIKTPAGRIVARFWNSSVFFFGNQLGFEHGDSSELDLIALESCCSFLKIYSHCFWGCTRPPEGQIVVQFREFSVFLT